MARIRNFGVVPRGGWRYVQPETGARLSASSFADLVRTVRKHRAYKGLPLDTIEREVETQLCIGLSTELCEPEPGEDYRPVRNLNVESKLAMATSLARALTAFVAGGGTFVEKAEAERRAAVCRGCPFNQPSKSCSCTAVYATIEALVPRDRRPEGISVCTACGCSLPAKVNLPREAVEASLGEGVVLPEWCWQGEGR